jgi:adenosine deaminase
MALGPGRLAAADLCQGFAERADGRVGSTTAAAVVRPASNVMLGRVDCLETHPIRKLYDAGVKVTVNTDDVLVFGNGVSEEFLSLYRAKTFNADELDAIRRSGLSDS